MSLLYPRAYTHLVGILKSFRLSYRDDMTPAFIGTQQQLWSLWHTNTSLTPCHQGCFLSYRVSKGTLTHRLTLKRIPEQYDAALYKEGRQPIVMYAWSVMCAMIQWITVTEISSSCSSKWVANSKRSRMLMGVHRDKVLSQQQLEK